MLLIPFERRKEMMSVASLREVSTLCCGREEPFSSSRAEPVRVSSNGSPSLCGAVLSSILRAPERMSSSRQAPAIET